MEINEDINLIEKEMDNIEENIKENLKFNIVGTDVVHKKYGKGKIIKQENNKINVEFLNKYVTMFQIPTVFTSEFLTCDSMKISEHMNQLKSLLSRKMQLEDKRSMLEREQRQNEIKTEQKSQKVIKNTTMIAVTTNKSFDEDTKINIYYCKAEKIKKQCEYIGLYKDKSIRAIGRIKKVIEANTIEGNLVTNLVYGEPVTEEDKEKIEESIKQSIDVFNCDIGQRNHKYFIVDKFIDTDFRKLSPGGLMGNKYFDLYDILSVETLPPAEELARMLEGKEWE